MVGYIKAKINDLLNNVLTAADLPVAKENLFRREHQIYLLL